MVPKRNAPALPMRSSLFTVKVDFTSVTPAAVDAVLDDTMAPAVMLPAKPDGGETIEPTTRADANAAYSDGCRAPIPIHIGQTFQFTADTCFD